MSDGRDVTVVGAGLTGCLLAARLHDRGASVRLVERRPDPRDGPGGGGRSINLALSTRGLDAVARIGLAEAAEAESVEVRGRMMHAVDGDLTFQPYGTKSEHVLRSVNRDRLNDLLLTACDERELPVDFDTQVVDVDFDAGEVVAEVAGRERRHHADTVFGADGAYSAVRLRMARRSRFAYGQDYLEHGYKELTIPAGSDGGWKIDPGALHIWPRGQHMLIALANPDGTFTCTLFWPYDGDVGFETIDTHEEVDRAFAQHFPDMVDLHPNLTDEYLENPVGSLVTIRCGPWYDDDDALLIGDAAHAVVPFYGQGANAALEDVTILCEILDAQPDWHRAFVDFYERRKPDTDALADLALDNFIEMRDHVASRVFLAEAGVKRQLHRLFPTRFVPLYTMVTFSRTPYAEARERSREQDRRLRAALVATLAAVLVAVAVVVIAVLQ